MSEEPEIAPTVRCISDIYHPNIDRYSCFECTNVCLNLFDDEWQPDFGLQDVVQGLLFLLHNPEPGHALLGGFDPENYDENVAKHKAGLLEIEDCDVSGLEDMKALPEHVESTDVMASRVEGLLEKLQEEDATADENDVTVGACAMKESANLNFDSAACVDNENGGATTTSENTNADDEATLSDSTNGVTASDSTNEVTVSDSTKEMVVSDTVNELIIPESSNEVAISESTNEVTVSNPVNANNDADFSNTVTNSAGTEQSLPKVNHDIVTDNPDKEAEDDQTSTDSVVDCDSVDTATGTNHVVESLNDSHRGLTHAYRRSKSLPNDYEKELKGNPIFCTCQSYDSTRDINDNNIVLLNAVELNIKENYTCKSLVTSDLDNRTSQQTPDTTLNGHYQSQRYTGCQVLTEQTLKTKWWAGCFPWLAK